MGEVDEAMAATIKDSVAYGKSSGAVCEGFLSNIFDGVPHLCHHCGLHRDSHEKQIALVMPNQGKEEIGEALNGSVQMNDLPSPSLTVQGQPKVFSREQVRSMIHFARQVGWNLNKYRRHPDIQRICDAIGVSKLQFRCWMHNNKKKYNSSSV